MHYTSPCFQHVSKPNYSDFLDSKIGEFQCIVHDGYHKHQFLGMLKQVFQAVLLVQQEIVGVLSHLKSLRMLFTLGAKRI